MPKWIDIICTGKEPRVSTLAIFNRKPAELYVMGNLPHGYTFKPTTAKDRDRLCNWLESLQYPVTVEFAKHDPHAGELGDVISDIGSGLDSKPWAENPDKDNWDMPSIIDRLSTLVDMSDATYEIDKGILADEMESMARWLKSTGGKS